MEEKIAPFFIDANIFLEVELRDEKSPDCMEMFSNIYKNSIPALTSNFIVYTCFLQLENKASPERMKDFALFLDNMESIEIHTPSYRTLHDAIEIMRRGLDFDDALVVSIMKSRGIEKLVSFDKDFDKIKEIRRVEPIDVF